MVLVAYYLGLPIQVLICGTDKLIALIIYLENFLCIRAERTAVAEIVGYARTVSSWNTKFVALCVFSRRVL